VPKSWANNDEKRTFQQLAQHKEMKGCTHSSYPFRGRLFDANEPLRAHYARLRIHGSVDDIDADDVRRILVGILLKENRGDLAEVVLDELREAPEKGHLRFREGRNGYLCVLLLLMHVGWGNMLYSFGGKRLMQAKKRFNLVIISLL
jgi:hypothetical protein